MHKETQQSRIQNNSRVRTAKSIDLKHRLFEIGLHGSPNKHKPSHLQVSIGTPKGRNQPKHQLNPITKENSGQILKYQPTQSPALNKTHGKDFQIRKNCKLPFSPKSPSCSQTVSSFFRQESPRPELSEIRDTIYDPKEEMPDPCLQLKESEVSKLDDYVSLILKGVDKIEEFLYLVRGSEENIYELELVNFQIIRSHEGEPNFEYYTVSRKGFCRYVGGKPQNFLEIVEWAQEKSIYSKIKTLSFFYRFRRWKTLQMWRRTVTRQRREAISTNLQERLFFLEPVSRKTLLELRKITLEMEKSVLIIARNEGTYTLESFKHCQQRARREASLAVEEFSRESRTVVRKCFDSRLTQLRESIKRNVGEEKQVAPINQGTQSPKENAFNALGFPSKMSYEHRSKLRKQTGKFLRFSYLVDSIHLSCLADLYSTQVQSFIGRLQELQLQEEVRLRSTIEEGKDQMVNERMFALQLTSNFKEVPMNIIDKLIDKQGFQPARDIKLKNEPQEASIWVPKLTQHWITLQPNIQEVLDELTFLLREGLTSLKCFERWSKHRQMQKYVSILQQWDDLVSEHWQISENDNLDPLLIIDNLQPILSRLKNVLRVTQNKFNNTISHILTALLNAFWEYQRLDLTKLDHLELLNPAQTFEQFLTFTAQLLEKVTNELPHRIQLGIIVIHVTRIKNLLGQKFAGIIQKLKGRLPQLVQQRTAVLNDWLSTYGIRLKQQILSIDDYVRTVTVIKEAEADFSERRDECVQLSQMYQTMQQFKMDTKRRKDFQTVTLKLKDQLDQLLIAAEQNIQRKADLYTREVVRYHMPNLIKDIAKTLETVEQVRFLKMETDRQMLKSDLQRLMDREAELIEQSKKCSSYLIALKLTDQKIESLEELSKQIAARVTLWQTLERWEQFTQQIQNQIVKDVQLSMLIEDVEEFRKIGKDLELSLPPNQVLSFLKQKVQQYYVNLPLLNGFSEFLSESHWQQIYDILPQRFSYDLRKRQFTFKQFLSSKVGTNSKQIQNIFSKCRIEAKLQNQYQILEDDWYSLVAKIKAEGRFNLISNGPQLRQDLDKLLMYMTQILADQHSQYLKQYSITYETLLSNQQVLEEWLVIQQRLTELQKLCKVLDIKKHPEYQHFQNAQKIYKQMSKLTLIKGSQSGIRLGKLLTSATDDKLSQIHSHLNCIQIVINNILEQHRKGFPSFYLFDDKSLLKLITENTQENIENTARVLLPGLGSLQMENERIMALITIDGDRFVKNPISLTSEVEQLLHQLLETMSQLHRRTLRTCRYKAIENNLTSMVDQYNIQHLLAISRVDFSHYATISIQNQSETPESLAQFRRVMRRDTADDIRNRQFIKNIPSQHGPTTAQKYDTLLMQQLIYEQILNQLIKANIQRSQQFIWASQLKFFWQDTSTDESNITVRQLHVNLKYGNEFFGSQTKVIIQNQTQLLLGLRLGETTVYTGNQYTLERLMNAVGYKMMTMYCSSMTTQNQLVNFTVGCHYADYLPCLCSADLLTPSLRYSIDPQSWLNDFRTNSMKKSCPYVKDTERAFTLFSILREPMINAHSFGESFRVINYQPPNCQIIKSGMQLLGLFSTEKNHLLLRVFELVRFLEERSQLQGAALEEFLDKTLKEEANLSEQRLFTRLLTYLKPKIAVQTHSALTKYLQALGLVSLQQKDINGNKMQQIVDCLWQRGVIVLGGRGNSKKYYLKQQLNKIGVSPTFIFGKTLNPSQLFTDLPSTLLQYSSKSTQKQIFYIEQITTDLLLAIQKLTYYQNFFTLNKNMAIIIEIPILDKFMDPHALASFPVFNFESAREMIDIVMGEWIAEKVEEERQKVTLKVMQDVVLPCLQSLHTKEDIIVQSKFMDFLKYYNSILPVKNPLEGCIYCLALMHRGNQEQLLKLDYLTKKQLSDDYFSDGAHIHQLVYCKNIPKEGLVSQSQHLRYWLRDQTFNSNELVMTVEYAHLLAASRRIHETDIGVVLEGRANSGKSTFLQMYRQINHKNSSYLTISCRSGQKWQEKIGKVLQRHGLGIMGARINYKQTIIMVEDVHLGREKEMTPLQMMLNYQKWQNKQQPYNLKNIKYILTGQSVPPSLTKNTSTLRLNNDQDTIRGIFGKLLEQNIESEWNMPLQMVQKMASSTLELCCKVIGEREGEIVEAFGAVRRVLAGFGLLKFKESNNPIKEIEKYWTYALQETLTSYDSHNILSHELKSIDLTPTASQSYTHLLAKPLQKKLQLIKQNKRLFNVLNERIERYNQGDTKRYGQNFQFINFDSLLQKIISLSHSILFDQDHLLLGRRGSGKESLVKLTAFFNGLHFKNIGGNIMGAMMELYENVMPVPHLILKRVNTVEEFQGLKEYCECDFEGEVLGCCEGRVRTGIREREKDKMAMMQKTTKKEQMSNQTFTMPKLKPSWQDALSFRKSFRLVLAMTSHDLLKQMPIQIRKNFHVDIQNQVPTTSILQYNQKLLAVDGVNCCKEAQTLITQIYQHSRQKLGISLRGNDDSVRLFSSFVTNLIPEMKIEAQRFGKILELLNRLRVCNIAINGDLGICHAKLKELSQPQQQTDKDEKANVEHELRQKSTALAVNEKLIQMLGWMQEEYKSKHKKYQYLLEDQNKLEFIFAVTACYFIYLSNTGYKYRRQILEEWYSQIQVLSDLPPLPSFLPLFLLYQQEFNAEQVDNLPDFYQNMAIIFHSAKPIVIRDVCQRGRAWLEKNCSFVYLKDDQKEFIQTLGEYLVKPTNILIEVTEQATVEKLTESVIGTLLFLPESDTSVNLRGEDVQVHQEAKVYMLLGEGIVLPKHVESQFTVVLFQQNRQISKKAIIHQYLCARQREHQYTLMDFHRKLRNIKLDCQNAMSQVAESIHDHLLESEETTDAELIDNLSKINDKLMIRAQNQFTKVKEKQEMVMDLKEKCEIVGEKINEKEGEDFEEMCQKVYVVLKQMEKRVGKGKGAVSYAQYFNAIKQALTKGIITNVPTLALFALRQWGPIYTQQQYVIFALLLATVYHNSSIQDLVKTLTPEYYQKASIFTPQIIETDIAQTFIDVFQKQSYLSINPLIRYKKLTYEPIVWPENRLQKIVQLMSAKQPSEIREQLLALSTRIIEPSQDDSLQTLLKKNSNDGVTVLTFDSKNISEYERVLKHWNLQQNSVILVVDNKPQSGIWTVQFDNAQSIFKTIIESYTVEPSTPNTQKSSKEELFQNANKESQFLQAQSSLRSSQVRQSSSFNPSSIMGSDNLTMFIKNYVTILMYYYSKEELPLPIYSQKELDLIRKCLERQEMPLNLDLKVKCIIEYTNNTLSTQSSEVLTQVNSLNGKLIKIASKESQEEFFREADVLMLDGKEYKSQPYSQTIKMMKMELGWLSQTRKFLGLSHQELTQNYLQPLQIYIEAYKSYQKQPQVSRGSKRQQNLRNKKDSITKRGRDSIMTKKQHNKLLTSVKITRNPLATILLLKQTQQYEKIVKFIHRDLVETKKHLLQNKGQLADNLLEKIVKVMQEKPTAAWKSVLSKVNCGHLPITPALSSLLTCRNELFTMYNKFMVSDCCQIDFRFMQKPDQFLRTYFGVEFTNRDVFLLSTQLSPEETEKGEHVRVVGMWGVGWKMSGEGMVQTLGEGKSVQMGACYLIKKSSMGLGYCPVDVSISPLTAPFMRLFATSKKMQQGLKLYLHNES